MNLRYRTCIVLFIVSIVFFTPLRAQEVNCREVFLMTKLIKENHVEPREIDDTFSHDVYDLWTDDLNLYGLFFTQQDMDAITQHSESIDDYLTQQECGFLNNMIVVFNHRLAYVNSVLDELGKQPLDISEQESIFMVSQEEKSMLKDDKELKDVWQKYFKYEVLSRLCNQNDSISNDSLIQKLDLAKESTYQKLKNRFTSIETGQGGTEQFVMHSFYNAVANAFDPHTMYFSPFLNQQFEEMLSTESLSYGIEFDENSNGDIIIKNILPGGAAWNTSKIWKNDVIEAISFVKSEAMKDVTIMNIDEFLELFSQTTSNEMTIQLVQKDGNRETVHLKKTKASTEENVIKNVVLKGDKKIGYLMLPSFYTSWEDDQMPLGCSNDVAKEILKLKRENIDGLIIDLRYNGGGSMWEATGLAGIFINEGPMFMHHTKEEKPMVMKDRNRGTVYDGPLLILVNQYSASASEIVASTLQDYRRAIIVGENTYGKATSQITYPVNNFADPAHSGFIKVTTGRLYRVTGETHQFTGVVPDIALPGLLEYYEVGEKYEPHALKSDKLDKKLTYTALPDLPLEPLKEKSAARTKDDKNFKVIKALGNIAKARAEQDRIEIPLQLDGFRKYLNETDYSSRLDSLTNRTSSLFTVESDLFTRDLLSADEYRRGVNDEWMDIISKDIYISESYRILMDLIMFEGDN